MNETTNHSYFQVEWYNPCIQSGRYIEIKYFLVLVCGTSIAIISALQNVLLLYVLIIRLQFRASHLLYITILALFDILVALGYIAIMSVQVLMEYKRSVLISIVWHGCLRPLFTVSHVATTASTFLIIAATVERFITSARLNRMVFTQKRRIFAAATAIVVACITKGTIFFEFVVIEQNCTNQNRYAVTYSPLAMNYWFNTIWMYWTRNITTVFLPFILLAYMNMAIVRAKRERTTSLRATFVAASMGQKMADESKVELQAATRMLILVVSTYLVANTLNVLITAWEHIDMASIRQHHKFYTLSADVVSLLTVICTALRLPIYMWCNKWVRKELFLILAAVSSRFRLRCITCKFEAPPAQWTAHPVPVLEHLQVLANSWEVSRQNSKQEDLVENGLTTGTSARDGYWGTICSRKRFSSKEFSMSESSSADALQETTV